MVITGVYTPGGSGFAFGVEMRAAMMELLEPTLAKSRIPEDADENSSDEQMVS